MNIEAVLRELTALSGASGFEALVAARAVELLSAYTDEAYLDRFGNAVGLRRCGKEGAKRLLLDAHLDEVGLIVTGVQEGFLDFSTIGGVDPRVLPNQNVCVCSDPPRVGLISSQPPHLQEGGAQNRAMPLDALWIDCGLTQEEAAAQIPIGTPVVFDSPLLALQNGRLSAKAMDDRAGFAVLLWTAELLQTEQLDVDLCFLGSTREETSGSGALVGSFALRPDYAVAVDVTHGSSPDAPRMETFPLGKGPTIGIGPTMDKTLGKRLMAKAKDLDISWQAEVMGGSSGTNAWHMQTCREGLPTAVLSIPLKYMHTPNEVLCCSDLEDTARLLAAFVRDFAKEEGVL